MTHLIFGALDSVSSNARRYPTQKQDLAFVHFNITAGMWLLDFLVRATYWALYQRLVTFIPLEYETIIPLSWSGIRKRERGLFYSSWLLNHIRWQITTGKEWGCHLGPHSAKERRCFHQVRWEEQIHVPWHFVKLQVRLPFPFWYDHGTYCQSGIPGQQITLSSTTSCPMSAFWLMEKQQGLHNQLYSHHNLVCKKKDTYMPDSCT